MLLQFRKYLYCLFFLLATYAQGAEKQFPPVFDPCKFVVTAALFSDAVSVDYERDVSAEIVTFFGKHGVTIPPATTQNFRALTSSYAAFIDRHIPTNKRKVNVSPALKKTIASLPAAIQSGYSHLVKAIEDGSDLNPYQSRKFYDIQFKDLLFNSWRIRHFHLGGPPAAGEELSPGTSQLLYAVLTKGNAYLIDVKDHKSFSDQELLDILFTQWAKEFKTMKVDQSVIVPSFNNDQIHAFRKLGLSIAAFNMSNGSVYMPFGAISAAGGSIHASVLSHQFHHVKYMLYDQIADHFVPFVLEAEKKKLNKLRFQFVMDHDSRIIRVTTPDLGFSTGGVQLYQDILNNLP